MLDNVLQPATSPSPSTRSRPTKARTPHGEARRAEGLYRRCACRNTLPDFAVSRRHKKYDDRCKLACESQPWCDTGLFAILDSFKQAVHCTVLLHGAGLQSSSGQCQGRLQQDLQAFVPQVRHCELHPLYQWTRMKMHHWFGKPSMLPACLSHSGFFQR